MEIKSMGKKITWQDLHNATFKELKKTYKLSDRQLEQQVVRHLDGANSAEKQALYKTVWDKHRM